jgi:hypothetical protein
VAVIRTKAAVIAGAITASEEAPTSDQLALGSNVAGTPTTTTFVSTQAQADALAAYLASTSATDAPLVRITLDNDSTTRLQQIRDVELNDRVIATEAITGGTLDGFVEQVTHRITNGGLKHECELVIGARTRMVGIYSASSLDAYSLSTYSAANPTEPPPYATYGF